MLAMKSPISWSLTLALVFLCYGMCKGAATTADPTSADEDDVEEVPSTHIPKFISKPHSVSVLPGEVVTFPCEVDDLGTFATVWRKGEKDNIFANSIRLMPDTHFQRLEDRSLQIRRVRPMDTGHYFCIISSNPTIELKHTLTVQVPPKITSKMKTHITLNKGQPLNLNCEASGTPTPTIMWKLLDGDFADGRSIHEGGVLYTAHSTRHQAGTYECTADNGVGSPATQTVRVHINSGMFQHQHTAETGANPPELEPVRSWVHAGEETSAELTCKVRAHPAAAVSWKSPNGSPIADSEHYRIKSNGGEHSLQIRGMRKEDFGDYICEATNREGTNSAIVTVSGLASPAEFKSDPKGEMPNDYVLKWVTQSHSTVIDYTLRIKPKKEEDAWTEVRVPADSQQGLLKSQVYEVTGLEPATAYEAVVVVHNKFGDSQPSRHFVFYTQGASAAPRKDLHLEVQNEVVGHASSQSPAQPHQHEPEASPTPSGSKKLSSLLTVIILSVFFWF